MLRKPRGFVLLYIMKTCVTHSNARAYRWFGREHYAYNIDTHNNFCIRNTGFLWRALYITCRVGYLFSDCTVFFLFSEYLHVCVYERDVHTYALLRVLFFFFWRGYCHASRYNADATRHCADDQIIIGCTRDCAIPETTLCNILLYYGQEKNVCRMRRPRRRSCSTYVLHIYTCSAGPIILLPRIYFCYDICIIRRVVPITRNGRSCGEASFDKCSTIVMDRTGN